MLWSLHFGKCLLLQPRTTNSFFNKDQSWAGRSQWEWKWKESNVRVDFAAHFGPDSTRSLSLSQLLRHIYSQKHLHNDTDFLPGSITDLFLGDIREKDSKTSLPRRPRSLCVSPVFSFAACSLSSIVLLPILLLCFFPDQNRSSLANLRAISSAEKFGGGDAKLEIWPCPNNTSTLSKNFANMSGKSILHANQ